MADTTIGRVTYVADVDGKVAIAESYLIGGKMADAMEKGFIQKSTLQGSMKAISAAYKGAGKEMVNVSVAAKNSRREVIDLGHVIATTGEKWEASGRKGMLALEQLSEAVVNVRKGFDKPFVVDSDGVVKLGGRLDRLKGQVQQFGDKTRTALGGIGGFFRRTFSGAGLDRFNGHLQVGTGRISSFVRSVHTSLAPIRAMNQGVKDLTGGFRRLGPGMRRFVFYAVLFTAIMPELAALSSGAAGGLAILALSVGVLVAGLAAGVVAFTGLLGEVEDLAPGVLPARQALDALKETFVALRDAMTVAAAGPFVQLFDNLRATFAELTPFLAQFAAIVVQALADMSAGLLPGTDGFTMLRDVITTLGPLFQSLIGILSPLASALGGIFLTAAPFIQAFAVYLTDILTKFSEWVNSAPGVQAISGWFEQAGIILGAVAELAGDLGDALGAIVTPEVVSSLVSFLGQLGGFLPAIVALLDVVEKLQIFGILGAIFDALGPILISLSKPFGELASVIGDALISAIETLGPILLTLLDAFMPILPVIGELIQTLLPPLVEVFNTLVEAIVPLLPPLLSIITVLLDAFMPIILPLVDLIGALAGVLGDQLLFAFEAIAGVLEALSPILTIIGTLVGALIETIVALITGDFSAIPGIWSDAWAVMSDAVNTMVEFVKPLWEGLVGFIQNLARDLGSFIGTAIYNIRTAWEGMWSGLEDIVHGAWNGILGFLEGGINGTVDLINGLLKGINNVGGGLGIHVNLLPKVRLPHFAAGTLALGPTAGVFGESGPEMVVPLRRPLSQVDPRVRDVSAYAQGKSTNVGKTVNFNEGAIQVVTPARNPALVANMVVDRITEDALN